MNETHHSTTDRFLWWLTSVDPDLLKDNPSDQRRFSLIGLSILCTWIFATIAWTYFFSTVTTLTLAVFGGVLMGFIVLVIDRVLVASLQGKTNNNTGGPIAFRIALALCLGAFMAQPALLFLFEKDINIQLAYDNEIKKQNFVKELQNSMSSQYNGLLTQKDSLANLKSALDTQIIQLRKSYLAETDGSGGTGKVGIATIAKAKKAELDQVLAQAAAWEKNAQPILQKTMSGIDSLDKKRDASIAAYDQQAKNGFLSRIEALQNLLDKNIALRWRYMLLLCIIMLIELSPLLSKLLLKTNIYNQRLILSEGLLLNLDREVFDKKYSESRKYSDAVHTSNMESIDALSGIGQAYKENLSERVLRDFELKNNRLPSYDEYLLHYKTAILGRHA